MKMIQLISFTELCSNTFLRFLDQFDQLNFVNDKFIVDISSHQSRVIMAKLFGTEVKNARKYGTINIYINACRVASNWRNDNTVIRPKYELVDDSLIVNPHKLEAIFDTFWNMLCKTHDNTFKFDDLDISDTGKIIQNAIGQSFITHYQSDYVLIQDGNKNLNHSLLSEIPDYLITEVETSLRMNQLI